MRARLLGVVAAALAAASVFTAPAVAQQPRVAVDSAVLAMLDAKGSTDFYLRFAERADLTAAAAVPDWDARGAAVVAALRDVAHRSQAGVRAELDAAKADYRAYWASNTILVTGGTRALFDALATHAGVRAVTAPREYALPAPAAGTAERTVDAVEWGVAAVNADDVWALGVRGEGVVVAGVDTGVQYDHPALVANYRGNIGGGTVDHDHNWFDPSSICPTQAPCDNNAHGTHTMGSLVGDDGAGNQIGVAPGARWIAAKGCAASFCSDADLLASAQWLLAPTDLTGADPRPDLRPHIVNNSWGGGGGDPWFTDAVAAWRASGIFPVFSAGGSGPGCGGVGSPADYADSYAAGAFDINGTIAGFSARGGSDSLIKPDAAAPGVNIRSSVLDGQYAAFSGTSMSAPHIAGAAALVLSAAPSLRGDVDQLVALLDRTAVDVSDLTCGGTPDDNNVWGEGRIDALAAVLDAPTGAVGTLTGTVTSAGVPVAGAAVHVAGPILRDLTTNSAGGYLVVLPAGTYTVTVSTFGYRPRTVSATVTENNTTTRDVTLRALPADRVRGWVRDSDGSPLAGVTVAIPDTPIPAATTDRDGEYTFESVPHGTYHVTATGEACLAPQTSELVVNGRERLNFELPRRADTFGYTCTVGRGAFVAGTTPVALTGDDASTAVPLPFAFPFYGATYGQAFVSTNGHLSFTAASTAYANGPLPSAGTPNAAVYPFWDDLILDASSGVYTRTTGTAPRREFTIEWRNAVRYGAPTQRLDLTVTLGERGSIVLRYHNLDPAVPTELGSLATVGIENATGTDALQFSLNTATLSDARSIRFHPPGT